MKPQPLTHESVPLLSTVMCILRSVLTVLRKVFGKDLHHLRCRVVCCGHGCPIELVTCICFGSRLQQQFDNLQCTTQSSLNTFCFQRKTDHCDKKLEFQILQYDFANKCSITATCQGEQKQSTFAGIQRRAWKLANQIVRVVWACVFDLCFQNGRKIPGDQFGADAG